MQEPIIVNPVNLAKRPIVSPAVSGSGSLVVCHRCYPMFAMTDQPLHNGDVRHGTITGHYAKVVESGCEVPYIEQAVYKLGVRGLVLREFVTDEGGCWHRCEQCNNVSLVRLRYAPEAVLVFVGLPDHLRDFVPIGVRIIQQGEEWWTT